MQLTFNNYPYFDLSEFIPDFDLSINAYLPLKPLRTGDYITDFKLETGCYKWDRFYNGAETHGPVVLKQFLNKPLVICFFSRHWQQSGFANLNQLNAVQHEITANGGNLLIVNAENDNDLPAIACENNWSLNFYNDDNHEIAEKFKVFSPYDPTWNNFSGIDINIPLLATFVLDSNNQIVYDHLAYISVVPFSTEQIISVVYKSSLNDNRRSA